MKISEAFPSKYMKAEDFEEGEVRILTIRNIEIEELGQDKNKKEAKPVISFREPNTKGLVLNKTNAAIIAKFYGDEMDDWIGKKIALHVIEVESFGDVVKAIRVKTKQPAAVEVGNIGQGVKIPSKQAQPPEVFETV